jgi:hypothetical protein
VVQVDGLPGAAAVEDLVAESGRRGDDVLPDLGAALYHHAAVTQIRQQVLGDLVRVFKARAWPVRNVHADRDVVDAVRVQDRVPHARLKLDPLVVEVPDRVPAQDDPLHHIFGARVRGVRPDVDALAVAGEATGVDVIALEGDVRTPARDFVARGAGVVDQRAPDLNLLTLVDVDGHAVVADLQAVDGDPRAADGVDAVVVPRGLARAVQDRPRPAAVGAEEDRPGGRAALAHRDGCRGEERGAAAQEHIVSGLQDGEVGQLRAAADLIGRARPARRFGGTIRLRERGGRDRDQQDDKPL